MSQAIRQLMDSCTSNLSRFIVCAVCAVLLSSPMAFAEAPPEQVDINSASVEQLAVVLDGIGTKKAQAIIAYREANGKFKSVEEITEVKGIGDAMLEKNRARIKLKSR